MRTSYRRRNNGEPLREALRTRRMSCEYVAGLTKTLDPDGRGVSLQTVASLATDKAWARETTSERTAKLIAQAIGYSWRRYFTAETIGKPKTSATSRNSIHRTEQTA